MVCSGMAESAGTRSGDAMTAHCTLVQAFGQDAEGADKQGPQGGADEARADAENGELLGYVGQVDFVH